MTRPSIACSAILVFLACTGYSQTAPAPAPPTAPPTLDTPLTATAILRERTNATQWFAATPTAEVYGHQDSLLRLSVAQRSRHFDYMLDMGNSTELGLPSDAVSSVAAQGQLGLGGSYFAANGGNTDPVAASFRQGFLRYHFDKNKDAVRIGRFEFFDGAEMAHKNTALAWLQANRMQQRLVGNFGFSNGQRSFDGLDGKFGGKDWDITAMAGRATQGVFNMNANPELNVDIQYLSYTHTFAKDRLVVRGFGLDYHDGRTGLTKTDSRTAAARALDHKNIRLGSYGGDAIAAIPLGKNTFDLLFWGVVQNGHWGLLDQSSAAVAVEGGLRLDSVVSKPWLRGGMLRTTGDNNNTDGTHNTFVTILNTPRFFARFPFFNMMNSKDEFVQLIDKPTSKMDLRTDLHFLQLTAPTDFWYTGGGAFDNKVFGFTGRAGNNHGSFASYADVSLDYALTKQVSVTGYYAKAFGRTVVNTIYPIDHSAQYGFFELNYKLSKALTKQKRP